MKHLQQSMSLRLSKPIQHRARIVVAMLGLFVLSTSSSADAQTAPNRRPANVTSAPIPTESKAVVDVLGIKLGKSSADDVQAVLKGMTPPMTISDDRGWLVVKVMQSGQKLDTRVPNSDYQIYMSGTTQPYTGQCQNPGTARGDCDYVIAHFSLPPGAGVAAAIYRQFLFAERPSLQNVAEGFVKKYGEPSFVTNYNNYSRHFTYVWAWDFAGTPLRIDTQHPCANNNSFITIRNPVTIAEYSKPALQRGCAAYVQVQITADNGVATGMQLFARDHFTTYIAALRAQEYAANALANADRERLNKASGAPVPKN